MIASGFSAAISSILPPPCVDVMITGPPKRRSNATRREQTVVDEPFSPLEDHQVSYMQSSIHDVWIIFRTWSISTPVYPRDQFAWCIDDGQAFLKRLLSLHSLCEKICFVFSHERKQSNNTHEYVILTPPFSPVSKVPLPRPPARICALMTRSFPSSRQVKQTEAPFSTRVKWLLQLTLARSYLICLIRRFYHPEFRHADACFFE